MVVISLSGGVDSMVSSFILKKLNFQVSALMINYQNRKQSARETEFVSSWCHRLNSFDRTTTINYLSKNRDKDRVFMNNLPIRLGSKVIVNLGSL